MGASTPDPNEVVMNVPGFGPVTRAQIDAANEVALALKERVREIAQNYTNEEIVALIHEELARAQIAQLGARLFGTSTPEGLDMANKFAESQIIAGGLESVLRDRFNIDPAKCQEQKCDDCPVKALIAL